MRQDTSVYARVKTSFGEIDVMRAWYVNQHFNRHTHDGYGLGAINGGAMEFNYRGEKLIASRGLVNSVNPDEPHDGHSFDIEQGWHYSMLYFSENVFRNIYADITDRYKTPYIKSGIFKDIYLMQGVSSLVNNILAGNSDKLFIESHLLGVLSTTILHHSDKRPQESKAFKLGSKVKIVKSYISDNITEKISIKELADLVNMSQYHFIRSFRNDVGMTPYEYVSVKRTAKAKELILSGEKPVSAAFECGYTDQSHMNKWLKRLYGITPSNIRRI